MLNHFIEEYKSKLIDIDQLPSLLKTGMKVFLEQAAGEPSALINALMKHAGKTKEIQLVIVPIANVNKTPFAASEYAGHWQVYTFASTPSLRRPITERTTHYIPAHLSEIPPAISETIRPDIALIQVSPPDTSGFCNLGVAVDYTRAAIETASTVIAQVNNRMPVTSGDTGVHLSEITHLVEADAELIQFPSTTPGAVDRQIGELVATLVPDGATVQFGIGSLPDAILGALMKKHDLGIHSGLITDLVVDLIEAGVITGKRKKINPRKVVATMLIGTERLYRFCDRNPTVELYQATYTHNRAIISQLDNFISINSAIEIDLTGQINCESVNGEQVATVGGQVDFIRIARLSRGGKAIIAMPSTIKGKSKIIPQLNSGAPVSTARTDVDYIVTEFGVACLRHRSLRERARSLAEIAHPDFRKELSFWAQKT